MVLITNTTDKFLYRRLHRGGGVSWNPGETIDIKDEGLANELRKKQAFQFHDDVSPASHLPQPIVGRRPSRPIPPEAEEKVDRGLKPKRRRKKARSKGLRKKADEHPGMICGKAHPGMKHADWKAEKKDKKGIGIDLDGDGKVDVVVGGD
jgi:hypothetical protein|tara:strand:- start:395 stop:844 length:450 start_codon:yes stop_codon:yes gene_type:complete